MVGYRKKEKLLLLCILFLYIIIVLWLTVFKRPITFYPANLDVLWSYRRWLSGDWKIGEEILLNIAMFVPFGFLLSASLGQTRHKYSMSFLTAFLLSGLIEILQIEFMRGLFEYDDIINNTFGAIAGAFFYQMFQALIPQKYREGMITFITIIILVGCFMVNYTYDTHYKSDEPVNVPGYFCFQVETVCLEGNNLTLTGTIFRYKKQLSEPLICLKTDDTVLHMDVRYGIKREAVNNYFGNKYDYSKSGFVASTVIDPTKEYEIITGFDWGQYIQTGVFLISSNIHYCPETVLTLPKVKSTSLLSIIENGYLRSFQPDYHCWVYQYENALYWIADKDFCFEEDGSTYIQYQLWTTQPENLPKERLDNGWYWDNIGGNFEDYEITEMINCGQYRVMKRDLPAAYPITSILTGYYKNGKWIWQDYFRPVYNFE